MKKNRLLCALILTGCFTGSAVQAQQNVNQPLFPAPPPLAPHAETPPSTSGNPYGTGTSGLDDWLADKRPCCEGAPGRSTPLYTEWYVNSGVSVPFSRATSDLARELQTGWSIMGGARGLLYDETLTRAWVVDLHIINTNESAGHNNQGFPLTIFTNSTKTVFGSNGVPLATLQDSNRTMVGLGIGRMWYLWKSADSENCHWRIGTDFGVRYGTHKVDLNQFGHVTDVISGVYLAVRSDLEFPYRSIVLFVGGRFEWAYTGSDILQTRNSDLQDLNIMFTGGFRY